MGALCRHLKVLHGRHVRGNAVPSHNRLPVAVAHSHELPLSASHACALPPSSFLAIMPGSSLARPAVQCSSCHPISERLLQLFNQHARLSILSVSMQVPSKLRLAALLGILRSSCRPGQPGKAVVFMSSCDSVEFHYLLLTTLAEELVEDGQPLLACPVFMLHGNMPQVTPLGCCCCCVGLVYCKASASTHKDVAQHSKIP